MIRSVDEPLFCELDLRALCDRREKEMLAACDTLPREQLITQDLGDVAGQVSERFKLHAPTLREAEIEIDQREVDADVSKDRDRHIFDRSKPFIIKATRITFFVPFEGDGGLFSAHPSSWSSLEPRGTVSKGVLTISYDTDGADADALQRELDQNLRRISDRLRAIGSDARMHNDGLPRKAMQRIEARQQKLEADAKLVQGLKFPMRRREHSPKTFEVPAVRRKALPTSAKPARVASTPAPEPEPMPLAMDEYEHILSVCSSMVHVMERSPSSGTPDPAASARSSASSMASGASGHVRLLWPGLPQTLHLVAIGQLGA